MRLSGEFQAVSISLVNEHDDDHHCKDDEDNNNNNKGKSHSLDLIADFAFEVVILRMAQNSSC